MLQAQAVQSFAAQTFPPFAFQDNPGPAPSVVAGEPELSVTFSTVTLDGSNLWREVFEVAVSHLTEALQLADRHHKSEVLIANITPWLDHEQADPTEVTECQQQIEEALHEACRRLRRETPEARLSLRGGAYEMRLYTGREKPTDYVYSED